MLIDTFAFTNPEGSLQVTIIDSMITKFELDNSEKWDFIYSIRAEITDASGESHNAESSCTVSSRPLSIKLPVFDIYEKNELKTLLITVTDINAGRVSKDIRIKVHRIDKEEKIDDQPPLIKTDMWLYTKEQLEHWFPGLDFRHKKQIEVRNLVLETTINTGRNEKLSFDAKNLVAGNYEIETYVEENGKLKGLSSRKFKIFDEKENKLPGASYGFYHLAHNSVSVGDTV